MPTANSQQPTANSQQPTANSAQILAAQQAFLNDLDTKLWQSADRLRQQLDAVRGWNEKPTPEEDALYGHGVVPIHI